MLDLGFLEDVERILAAHAQRPPDGAVQRDDAAADPQARRPLPLRPGHRQGRGRDADRRLGRAVPASTSSRGQGRRSSSRCSRRAPDQAIVFVRTKIRCDQLYRKLRDGGMNVRALHGDMSQGSRDGVMLAFKGGRVPILVATDVAARGLDISTVTHVINFDVPVSPDVYVHRIGRTGRVGRSGRAITFVEPRQQRELEAIEQHIGTRDRAVERGRQGRAGPGRAERPRGTPSRKLKRNGDEARGASLLVGAGRARASSPPIWSTPSPPPPGSTARRSATCACSSASRSCAVPEQRGRARASSASTARAPDGRRAACGGRRVADGCALPPACGYGKLHRDDERPRQGRRARSPDDRPAVPGADASRGRARRA